MSPSLCWNISCAVIMATVTPPCFVPRTHRLTNGHPNTLQHAYHGLPSLDKGDRRSSSPIALAGDVPPHPWCCPVAPFLQPFVLRHPHTGPRRLGAINPLRDAHRVAAAKGSWPGR